MAQGRGRDDSHADPPSTRGRTLDCCSSFGFAVVGLGGIAGHQEGIVAAGFPQSFVGVVSRHTGAVAGETLAAYAARRATCRPAQSGVRFAMAVLDSPSRPSPALPLWLGILQLRPQCHSVNCCWCSFDCGQRADRGLVGPPVCRAGASGVAGCLPVSLSSVMNPCASSGSAAISDLIARSVANMASAWASMLNSLEIVRHLTVGVDDKSWC